MKDFDKFDETCKRYGLSNVDQALLLQVTPVMISRYRADSASMPTMKWEAKLQVAVNVMKAVVSNKAEPISDMTASRRRKILYDTMVDQNPALEMKVSVH